MSGQLLDDVTRCLGLLPHLLDHGVTQRCVRRDSCARYLQRAHGGAHTPVAQWLCPGNQDYWQYYIEVML